MEAILHWGLGAVRAVQGGASPAMVSLMRIASALGSGAALLALVALAYWCVDGKKGLRLGAALLVSAWANLALKFLLDQPRPGFFDPALELGYSFSQAVHAVSWQASCGKIKLDIAVSVPQFAGIFINVAQFFKVKPSIVNG